MRAIYIDGHGGNEVVHVGERPNPQRHPGEVLIRMQASTLNQVDLYMRNSGAGITHQLPQTMGIEGFGHVAECDAESGFNVGDAVVIHPSISCGQCEFCLRGDDVLCTRVSFVGEHRDGAWSDYLVVPARNVLHAPSYLTDFEAAALAVTHLTAWRMLVTQGQLKAGQTVLIFGIGGGVSVAALQLAKAMGVRVIVTSRHAHKLARAKDMGAELGIHTPHEEVVKSVMAFTHKRGVDLVIENVGEAVWGDAMKSLVRGGRLVTCGATSGDQPPADLRRIFIRQLQILGSTLGNLQEFKDLLAFCEHHHIRPVIDRVYTMHQVHDALDVMSRAEQFGKLALDLQH
ncbi:zinc-binding dehydrogenase [Limnohabitans sp.]|uniref:zinc-binding dehydrogenase n=1 Tax=Limnohabitans sp. TaxID=1907725 RepID=UPI00286EB716|nr:zinc-binding dehydrogenase [Limnohabitans sp.]